MNNSSANKIRVAVLYGGRSSEHEISLQSAANVIENLDPNQFEVIPIGIDKAGQWFLGNEVFKQSIAFNKVHALPEHGSIWFTPEWVNQSLPAPTAPHHAPSSPSPQSPFDVIFPVVHGTDCEDGTLQGLLELAGLPYVGCGVMASAMGMDKDISKRLAAAAGIPVGPYMVIKQAEWAQNAQQVLARVHEYLSFPVFVKPANAGSSIGITKVKEAAALSDAIACALQFDTKILIEKAFNVMELEVAVLESLDDALTPIVSVVGEVRTRHEFYSYDAKYLDENGAALFIPAPIDATLSEQVRAMAKEIFQVLECAGMARVDLFLDKETGELYFNEINTIPGFTAISMYPKLMAASGIPYPALLSHLIQLAIKRHQIKSQLNRSYTRAHPIST